MEETTSLKCPLATQKAWANVQGVSQDEGPNPAVPISYSPDFVETMDYFRAILLAKELSPRALWLTQRAVAVNSANYTGKRCDQVKTKQLAWFYRREVLRAMVVDPTGYEWDLHKELVFVTDKAYASPKNYQIWYHRRAVVEMMADG